MAEKHNCEQIIHKILHVTGDLDTREFELLDASQRAECVSLLFDVCEVNKRLVGRSVQVLFQMIPFLPSGRRYGVLTRAIVLFAHAEDLAGREISGMLDDAVINSLQPLELISFAQYFSNLMLEGDAHTKELALWGLTRLISRLHTVNQKEFALDVFRMSMQPRLRSVVLEALNALIYSMDQSSRSSLIFFFAETLKRNESGEMKYFVLDLLKKVTPALPERNRIVIADTVAPLAFFSDTKLVKRSIDFFAEIISLLPAEDRVHYTEIVAGLINDSAVRSEVFRAVGKALPFLPTDTDRDHFRELLRQYHAGNSGLSDHDESSFDMAYYYYND